jgi:ketosteroid isomerase-like protein
MISQESVAAWLDGYSRAWETYDPAAIADLFSADVVYFFDPYSEPARGRDAVVEAWLNERDAPGTYDSHYEPVLIEGQRAVANGKSRYYEADGKTLRAEFDNIFLLTFDEEGRCSEYREWYMKQPNAQR